MPRTLIAAALAAFVAFGSASAQENDEVPSTEAVPSLGTMTPEMWLYLHEQRRNDSPQMAVRQRAEMKASQRQARIAACKWFGVSNSRPSAAVTPFTVGTYSPTWTGNSWDPNRWVGGGNVILSAQSNYVQQR